MAIDNTEPKSLLILKIGVLGIALLVAGRFGLRSYFYQAFDAERRAKVGSTGEALRKLREQERKDLAGVGGAMKAVAGQGDGRAVQQSNDLAPLEGWSQLKRPLPTLPARRAAAEADAGDAGSDGSTTSDAAADAEPPKGNP